MRKRWLMCVLLGTLGWGQASPGTPPPQQPAQAPPDTSAAVAPGAAVITVIGVCPAQPKTVAATGTSAKATGTAKAPAAKSPAAGCKTVITKAEFERLANHLAPNVTPQMRKQLGAMLPELVAMAELAKKKGLDKTPAYEDQLKFVKMRILAQELRQNVQEEAAKISAQDIDRYYQDHAADYEQFNIDRLFVPRTKQPEPETKEETEKNAKLGEEEQKAKQAEEKTKREEGEQAMTQLAESLRTRAAAGEDFVTLQKEAFAAAGMKIQSPTVNLPSVRRNGLSPTQAAVFDLKAGEISQVINDAGGHYIFKVNSKTEIPLDQAQTEIRSKLQNERMKEMMEKLNSSFKTETNEAYFGPPSPAGPMGGPMRPGQMPPPRIQNRQNAPSPMAPQSQPQTPAQQPTPPPTQPPAAPPN
jgi:hypothetical protein